MREGECGEHLPRGGARLAVIVVSALLVMVGTAVGYVASRKPLKAPAVTGPLFVSPPGPTTPSVAPATRVPASVPRAPVRPPAARDERSALLAEAHAHLDRGALDKATPLYERVLGGDPNDAEALTHMGLIFASAGDADKGIALTEQALKARPGYPHALWDKGNALFLLRKDYAGAIQALEAFLRAAPDSPDAGRARELIAEARAHLATQVGGSPKTRVAARVRVPLD